MISWNGFEVNGISLNTLLPQLPSLPAHTSAQWNLSESRWDEGKKPQACSLFLAFFSPPPQLLLEKMIGGTKFKVINKNKSEASTWPKDLACLLCLAGQMSRPKSQITSTERLIPVSTHSPHYRSSDSEEEPMTWHWLSKSSSRMMSDYVSFQEAILEFWRRCPKSRIWIERSSWIIHGASG